MRTMNRILELTFWGIVCWVHNWVFLHGQGKSFYHYTHQGYLCICVLYYFAHVLCFCYIKLLMQIKMRNFITLSHRLLHTFLKIWHFYSLRSLNLLRNRWGWFWGLQIIRWFFLLCLFVKIVNILFKDSSFRASTLNLINI